MKKIIILIAFLVNAEIFAQFSIDSLQSNNEKVQHALNFYNKKNYEKAKSILEDLIAVDDKNVEAHYYLAYTLFKLNDLDGAIEACERAVELDYNNADYHYDLGRLYGEDAADASIFRLPFLSSKIRCEAETALELNPDHVGARILLANFYFQAPGIFGGSYNEAIKHANLAAELDPWQGRLLLIRIYNELEEYEKAEKECLILKKINTDNMELQLVFYNEYGYILLKKDRVDEAIEKYKKLVVLAPNKSWTHNALGRAYLSGNKYEDAFKEFNRALTINPHSEYAKEQLDEIRKRRGHK